MDVCSIGRHVCNGIRISCHVMRTLRQSLQQQDMYAHVKPGRGHTHKECVDRPIALDEIRAQYHLEQWLTGQWIRSARMLATFPRDVAPNKAEATSHGIPAWRQPQSAFKCVGQMTLVGKANL